MWKRSLENKPHVSELTLRHRIICNIRTDTVSCNKFNDHHPSRGKKIIFLILGTIQTSQIFTLSKLQKLVIISFKFHWIQYWILFVWSEMFKTFLKFIRIFFVSCFIRNPYFITSNYLLYKLLFVCQARRELNTNRYSFLQVHMRNQFSSFLNFCLRFLKVLLQLTDFMSNKMQGKHLRVP